MPAAPVGDTRAHRAARSLPGLDPMPGVMHGRIGAALTVTICALAGPVPALAAIDPPPGQCRVADLPGIAAAFARARRTSAAPDGRLDPGATAEAWRIARAVVGAGHGRQDAWPVGGDGTPAPDTVPCDDAVRRRDDAAWRLGLGGYSARETADVLEGHLAPADLDHARRRLMAGVPPDDVAAFLEARWREWPVAPAVPTAPARRAAVRRAAAARRGRDVAGLDAELEHLAAVHAVPAGLIRAVIAIESAGDSRAVSGAGAIGLMQLMPETARALGVDPWQPRENLRGGVVYLAALLRRFDGDHRLALIAYNAGPGHARDVQAGRAVAYRETRHYLAAIGARFPLP